MGISLAAFLAFSAESCSGKDDTTPSKPDEKEFTLDSYNGHFVQALSDAYKTFVETDELPASINVEGMTYSKAKYIAGACILLDKISTSPDKWQETDIELPKVSASSVDNWDTFYPDSLSLSEVKWLATTIYSYATEKGIFPNYCTFPTKYVESDGTEHDNMLTFNNSAVVLARLFHEYVAGKGTFPAKVSSWQSDFLRKTDDCEIDSPVVLAAAKEAIGTKTSVRDKAEALFNYSRDKWEWVDYSNTVKGSAKTITDKAGNCCDLSHALIAMTRASGIPARYMHGQCQFSSSVIGHVFVEMYVDGKWYICDPSNNSNTFGTHNWKHMVTFNGRYKTLPF